MSAIGARRRAEQLLEQLNIRTTPIDVHEIAKRLGIRVTKKWLGPGVSGLLVRTPGETLIIVAAKDARTRTRFTIAHEIGHHVLGHQLQTGEHVHVDRGNYISHRDARAAEGVDPKEIEANQFAAALLMPSKLVMRAVDAIGGPPIFDDHVVQLAREFDVSEQPMTIRLQRLGLL